MQLLRGATPACRGRRAWHMGGRLGAEEREQTRGSRVIFFLTTRRGSADDSVKGNPKRRGPTNPTVREAGDRTPRSPGGRSALPMVDPWPQGALCLAFGRARDLSPLLATRAYVRCVSC